MSSEDRPSASDISLIRVVLITSIVAFFLTAIAITAAYSRWSEPWLSSGFFAVAARFPWLRLSFVLSVVTLLLPFFAMSPAWTRRLTPLECALSHGLGVAPLMFFAVAPTSEQLGLFTDPSLGWALGITSFIHAVAAYIIATRLNEPPPHTRGTPDEHR